MMHIQETVIHKYYNNTDPYCHLCLLERRKMIVSRHVEVRVSIYLSLRDNVMCTSVPVLEKILLLSCILIIKNFLSMAIEWLLMPETITFLYSLERSRWRKHDGQSSNCKNCQSFLSRDDLLFHVEATLHLQVMSRLLRRRG